MKRICAVIVLLLAMCGCWDKTRVNNLQMIDVIGLDLEKENGFTKMSLAVSALNDAHQGGGRPLKELISSTGSNFSVAMENSDFATAGELTFNQSRLFILSKSYASAKPTNEMNVLGRIPSFPLTSSVAVYDGHVSELLARERIQGKTIANYLVVMLKEAESTYYIPKETVLRFILDKSDPFLDPALPLIRSEKDKIFMDGTALFREGRYTGVDLTMDQTKLALLMKNGKRTGVKIVAEIDKVPVQIWVKDVKRDIRVITKGDQVTKVILPIQIRAVILDTKTSDKALSEKDLQSLEKELTAKINEQALETIRKMQKANCDFLALAREIHAYHYKQWIRMDWRKEYPRLSIRPDIKVRILNSGVML